MTVKQVRLDLCRTRQEVKICASPVVMLRGRKRRRWRSEMKSDGQGHGHTGGGGGRGHGKCTKVMTDSSREEIRFNVQQGTTRSDGLPND